jgi:DNA-binding HxlR family transcriptional regulator
MPFYGQFCPVAMTAEVLTERWTPLIVRELLSGSTHFNELRRGVPLMSPSLLSKRLKMLERVGIVDRRRGDGRSIEYVLTPAGEELRPLITGMGVWGQRWARGDLTARHLDAGLLMWDIHRNINVDVLPPTQVVVHFHLRGSSDKKSRFWLVLDRGEVDVCLIDPGYEVDLTVRGHVRTLVSYWLGHLEFADAIRAGELTVDGPPGLVRALPKWFARSELATVELP